MVPWRFFHHSITKQHSLQICNAVVGLFGAVWFFHYVLIRMSSVSYYEKMLKMAFGGYWDPFLGRGTNGVGWVAWLGHMGFGVNNATKLGCWPHDPFAQASSQGTVFFFFLFFHL